MLTKPHFLFLALVILSDSAFADPLNGGLDLGTSTAGSYEARNTFIQPAALGFDSALNGPELSSSVALATHPTAKDDFNVALAWGYFGFGAERFSNQALSRFQLAVGVPLSPTLFFGTRLGLSRFDSGARSDAWDFGLQYRPSRFVSFGLLWNQANQPVQTVTGTSLPSWATAAVLVRPLPAAEFSLDVSTPSTDFFKTFAAQAMAGVLLAEGVKLRAGYHTQYQWMAGVQIHFGNASLFANVAPGADRKLVAGFQSTTSPYRSVLTPPKKVRMSIGPSLSDEKSAGSLLSSAHPSLLDLLQQLEELGREPSVRGLILRLEDFPLGLASAHEVFAALGRLRKAGKTVDIYLGNAGIKEYLIASAADRIYLEPAGEIRWLGLRSERYFLKGTLDKLGVEPEFLAAGKYKSAPEMFTRKELSESAKQAAMEEMRGLEGSLIELLTQSRKIDAARWKQLLALGLLSADEAKKEGLVDGLASFNPAVSAKNNAEWILPPLKPRSESLHLPPRVAVVVAAGNILPNRVRFLSLGSEQVTPSSMNSKLKDARDDGRTRAVVLRVSSPGGEVLASQQIATDIEEVGTTKPVYVSMGDVAASGGYYIAAPSKRIFAGPLTITGSIGVFLGKFNMSGLFQKLDLHKQILTDGPYPGLYGEDRAWSKVERAVMERRLNSYYDSFVAYVALNRHLTKPKVADVAQGRVWTGKQALERGLVDEAGGYYESIRFAAAQAGLEEGDYEAYEVETDSGWFGVLGADALGRAASERAFQPWSLLLSPQGTRDLIWLSTLRDSPFLYLTPIAPPDA